MSHEIRTPMNGILGAAMLLDEPDDSEELEKIMIIRRSSEALLAILNDILDFSKMESGRLSVVQAPFDMVETVAGCLRLVDNLAAEKQLALRFINLVGDHCHVSGDESRLRQIILNLLSNAIKFTPEGTVDIRLCVDLDRRSTAGKRAFFVEVRDTGIGIATADLGSVFDVFQQVDSTLVRQAGGTGLGLAISRQLARLMGGDLTVTSTVAEGSVFRLCLELAAAPAPVHADHPEQCDSLGLSVLLVEDNPTNRLVCRKSLEKMGCAVTLAFDGVDGLAAAETGDFDVILMDLQMPRMDGLMATGRIRALADARSRIPIVALTANAMHEDRDRCRQAGMNHFLTKPLRAAELRRVLVEVTGRPTTEAAPA